MRRAVASVWAVIATIFFVQTANGLQTSLLSVRAGIESFPAWAIGIVMASYYVGYSAAPLASRAIIGRAGHVVTMAIGIACAALVIAAHAFLVTPVAWAVLRVVSGFALSSAYVGAESWIHDRVENAQRGRVFSIYMVAQMIAMTLAQGLLSIGDPKSSFPFLLSAAIFLIGAAPVVFARHTAPHRAPPEPFGIVKLFFASPLGAIATVLAGVSWSIVFTFGPVYAQKSGFDLVHVSLFMALAMIGGALIQFPFGWLSDALGRRVTIAIMSAGGIAVSLFGLWADGQGDVMKYIASAFVGGLIFPMYAVSAAHTNDAIAPQNRVAAAAGLVLLFGLGSIFGPLVVGGVITGLGPSGFYVVLAATLTASLAAAATTR
ncbi:MAG TPA: MFS transporter [Rhizomicrobium sp.]|jgi:MFS family permease|nr:MFS transporter [Rhizomicrobium sp.]